MAHYLKKQEAVDPEIITEDGHNLSRTAKPAGPFDTLRRVAAAVLGAAAAALGGVMMFLLFAVAAVIVAVPMLILWLLGKKPDIKIFKYKL